MINKLINELVAYGIREHLVDEDDRVFVTNNLLDLFKQVEFDKEEIKEERVLADILKDMCDFAVKEKIIEDDSVTATDLFDTKIMGLLTPMPSTVRRIFKEIYSVDSKLATDYFYKLSKRSNYIRADRIAKDEKWVTDTEYGPIDITINLSKPEKDPRDIAKAGAAKKSGYPSCLLCMENEGYAGTFSHPARQNLRVIPIVLDGEDYFLQYSPYVYYNEHCIILNKEHKPMRIDRAVFQKLLEFVKLFPHYTAGSNADLPVVGGSILSHDHFQGGRYVFAMAKAPYDRTFILKGYEDLNAGIVKWPMSVIRLQGKDIGRIVDAADHILTSWRTYSDESAFIFSETEGIPHNTITPIARMRKDLYELDLVLRNNITTQKSPWGVYHPSADLHHIKKENIGLIEVMGLAVLPARLKREMEELEEYILDKKDIRSNEVLQKHADWVDEWINNYNFEKENIHSIVQAEISKVFVKVLECAGVYKRDEEGQEAFDRFIKTL
ncbi:UDP-glucose--hexose-1-phosphate uridylyltransferase [Lachnoanaerobaculum saburreum]|uniref:Galactose-1-phosphate uridylyltransferase n=1 Tax=Lachnoanaerobaculum saburreum DSM 3986 TaxID=887325 RepID=E6LJS1_9FIRM|nr:UDP-glucose--hexose-1-phosphate uridylyltransferase [Lachnoanaerobaculum saburreum]EFU77935.1 putative UTP--hexose-1-phosphate uridylyltransferase [Lachnoanaerobaculum saburreum DSM 3986]